MAAYLGLHHERVAPSVQLILVLFLLVFEGDSFREVRSGRHRRFLWFHIVEVFEPVVETIVGVLIGQKVSYSGQPSYYWDWLLLYNTVTFILIYASFFINLNKNSIISINTERCSYLLQYLVLRTVCNMLQHHCFSYWNHLYLKLNFNCLYVLA